MLFRSTRAGPVTRKLRTKSVAGESLSNLPMASPVCSREVLGTGSSPRLLDRRSHRMSRAAARRLTGERSNMRATTRAAPPPINPLRFNPATSPRCSKFTVESSVACRTCQVNVSGVESAPPLTLPLTSFYVHLTLRPLTGESREAYKKAAGKSHPDLHPVSSSSPPSLIV